MISVFVIGLLPDFFAIAGPPQQNEWCAAEHVPPPKKPEKSAGNAEREAD
jgi:hypothetical protein